MAQFPDEGQDLTAFGLDPSKIKTLALPHNLQAWPTSALSGCTALEKITAYGEEVENGGIYIYATHGLANLNNLVSIQFPSTVAYIGPTSWAQVFSSSTTSVYLPRSLRIVGEFAFYCSTVSSLNFKNCPNLRIIAGQSMRGANNLRHLDVSDCPCLRECGASPGSAVCLCCKQLTCVVFPPSLKRIGGLAFAAGNSPTSGALNGPGPVRTIIWKGRSSRPPIDDDTGIYTTAFSLNQSLDDLVNAGIITEIFVP